MFSVISRLGGFRSRGRSCGRRLPSGGSRCSPLANGNSTPFRLFPFVSSFLHSTYLSSLLHLASTTAKEAAAGELYGDGESRRFQSRTSMAYLKRRATEATTRGTKVWIAKAPILHSTENTSLPQGTKGIEEGDRAEVLTAAGRTCLDRTLP